MAKKFNSKLEKAKIRVNKITVIFSLIFFSFFVLIVFKNYSNITAVKYLTFSFISIVFSGYYIFEKGCIALTNDPDKVKLKYYPLPYIFLSLFIFFNIVAALFSPFIHYVNSKGQSVLMFGSGRYDGLAMLLLFILLFLCFSFEGTLGKPLINTCAVTTFIMIFLGFLQFAGLNPFYFYPTGNLYTYGSAFVSTLGNIDVMSTYLCITFAILAFAYIAFEAKLIFKLLWLFVYFLSILFLLKINVASGKLTIIIMTAVAAPVLAFKKECFVKYLDVLFATLFAVSFAGALNFSGDKSGKNISFEFIADKVFFSLLAIAAAVLILRFLINKFFKENYMKICGISIISLEVIAVISGLVFIKNYSGFYEGSLYELSEILKGKGKDSYGSNRYGLWKYTLMIIKERLFLGYGTGTYRTGLRQFAKELAPDFGKGSYDFAHNEYLQILYNCGIFGFVSYLGFIIWPFVKGAKKIYKNPKILVLGFSVLSYLIQAFFTFSIVIISPLFWILLGMLYFEVKKSLNECNYADNV